jgi:DNA-binding MarR family transcriptional regulator
MSKAVDDLLRRACAAQRLAMERALVEIDVTPAQFAAMERLCEEPGLSGSEIARGERLTPPTCSVIVANLERKRLLARRLLAKRGRAQYLELTPLGLEKVAAGAKAVEDVRRRLTADLEPEFQQSLMNWLQQLMDIDV